MLIIIKDLDKILIKKLKVPDPIYNVIPHRARKALVRDVPCTVYYGTCPVPNGTGSLHKLKTSHNPINSVF